MILQALVNHYENLAEQEKVDQEGWCVKQRFPMQSTC